MLSGVLALPRLSCHHPPCPPSLALTATLMRSLLASTSLLVLCQAAEHDADTLVASFECVYSSSSSSSTTAAAVVVNFCLFRHLHLGHLLD
eukprot:scaffold26383_cov31-Tisochrysis_lutea.AAC.1